eukprot:763026-Hanusia_phi.AAC.3
MPGPAMLLTTITRELKKPRDFPPSNPPLDVSGRPSLSLKLTMLASLDGSFNCLYSLFRGWSLCQKPDMVEANAELLPLAALSCVLSPRTSP